MGSEQMLCNGFNRLQGPEENAPEFADMGPAQNGGDAGSHRRRVFY
jgi:hypothetical protein